MRYVQENEPDTKMYLAWQEKNDPTKFLHLFVFEDAAAHARHGKSDAVRRFESVYSPELVGGEIVSTDYKMIAGKRQAEGTATVCELSTWTTFPFDDVFIPGVTSLNQWGAISGRLVTPISDG